jgi:phosphoribosylamine--glycine ligase
METLGPPWVVKADGLAGGKGVVVTEEWADAVSALRDRLGGGRAVVIEEFLDGEEASVIAFTDGQTVVPCEPAQDYKRVFDGDEGPNTGGMGSYSPVPACPPPLVEEVVETVLQPMVDATAARGAPFAGALYAGLALTSEGPKVLEFNARFGDPETQALLPRLDSDFGEAVLAAASGDLSGTKLQWSPRACVTVVLASGGYPGPHETGYAIQGLDAAASVADVHVFHAGTRSDGDSVVTSGGRVLNVSALGDTFASARDRAYEAARMIEFEDVHYRTDVAARAVAGSER